MVQQTAAVSDVPLKSIDTPSGAPLRFSPPTRHRYPIVIIPVQPPSTCSKPTVHDFAERPADGGVAK